MIPKRKAGEPPERLPRAWAPTGGRRSARRLGRCLEQRLHGEAPMAKRVRTQQARHAIHPDLQGRPATNQHRTCRCGPLERDRVADHGSGGRYPDRHVRRFGIAPGKEVGKDADRGGGAAHRGQRPVGLRLHVIERCSFSVQPRAAQSRRRRGRRAPIAPPADNDDVSPNRRAPPPRRSMTNPAPVRTKPDALAVPSGCSGSSAAQRAEPERTGTPSTR